MPSNSYIDFLELLGDVKKLMDTHRVLSKAKPGRKNLGYLTRSGMIMLCAAWERYTENIALESIDLILASDIQANYLPKLVKQYISNKVKAEKNEIYPIELADTGWRNIWKGYATNETDALNTPNSQNLNTLYKRLLGINPFTTFWNDSAKERIDTFVRTRGEIAHNGSKAKYVRFDSLAKNVDMIIGNCIQVDNKIASYLKELYNIDVQWEADYYRDIDRYKK